MYNQNTNNQNNVYPELAYMRNGYTNPNYTQQNSQFASMNNQPNRNQNFNNTCGMYSSNMYNSNNNYSNNMNTYAIPVQARSTFSTQRTNQMNFNNSMCSPTTIPASATSVVPTAKNMYSDMNNTFMPNCLNIESNSNLFKTPVRDYSYIYKQNNASNLNYNSMPDSTYTNFNSNMDNENVLFPISNPNYSWKSGDIPTTADPTTISIPRSNSNYSASNSVTLSIPENLTTHLSNSSNTLSDFHMSTRSDSLSMNNTTSTYTLPTSPMTSNSSLSTKMNNQLSSFSQIEQATRINKEVKSLKEKGIFNVTKLYDNIETDCLIYQGECSCSYNNKEFWVPIYIYIFYNIATPPRICIRKRKGFLIRTELNYINCDNFVDIPTLTNYTPKTSLLDIFTELQSYLSDQFPLTKEHLSIPPDINIQDIQMDSEELGSGATGGVRAGVYKGQEVAVKFTYLNIYNRNISDYYQEITIQYNLRHSNIIQILGIVRDNNTPGFVMERGVCSLSSLIFNPEKTFSPQDYQRMFLDITSAILFIHKKNYIHGDIKTENIIVMKDGHCKLTDFGSCMTKEQTKEKRINGTFGMLSPELLRGSKNITYKTDIYSLGCVFYECLSRKPMYEHTEYSREELPDRIINYSYRPSFPSTFPPNYRTLITSCWDDSPSERPSGEKILKELKKWGDVF